MLLLFTKNYSSNSSINNKTREKDTFSFFFFCLFNSLEFFFHFSDFIFIYESSDNVCLLFFHLHLHRCRSLSVHAIFFSSQNSQCKSIGANNINDILVTCSSWRLIYDRQVIYVRQTHIHTLAYSQKCLFLSFFYFNRRFFPLISMWLVHVNVLLSHISKNVLDGCCFFLTQEAAFLCMWWAHVCSSRKK